MYFTTIKKNKKRLQTSREVWPEMKTMPAFPSYKVGP